MQLAEDDMPIGFRTAATAASANGTMFAWADCSEEDIHKRVFMKQQAVDDALRHAMKICQEIRSPNEDDDATSSAPINFEERCGRDMKVWMAEIGAYSQPVIFERPCSSAKTGTNRQAS